VLGFILGKVLERYLFISMQRYGADWLWRPVVIIAFAMALLSLLRPLVEDIRFQGGPAKMLRNFGAPKIQRTSILPAILLVLFAVMLFQASYWRLEAKLIPTIVGVGALLFCSLTLVREVFARRTIAVAKMGHIDPAVRSVEPARGERMHMDIESHIAHLPATTKLIRGAFFFAWMLGFLGSMAAIGLIPTVPIFVTLYMRLEGRERWSLIVAMAVGMTLFVYALFDQLLAIPWPPSFLGEWLPQLKIIPSV
jgi:hypothetical protein